MTEGITAYYLVLRRFSCLICWWIVALALLLQVKKESACTVSAKR